VVEKNEGPLRAKRPEHQCPKNQRTPPKTHTTLPSKSSGRKAFRKSPVPRPPTDSLGLRAPKTDGQAFDRELFLRRTSLVLNGARPVCSVCFADAANTGVFWVVVLNLIGVGAGVDAGMRKAFSLKLPAQQLLCQRQTEMNTRK
jgi:hypothetical protein